MSEMNIGRSPGVDSLLQKTSPSVNPNIAQTDVSSSQKVSRDTSDVASTNTKAGINKRTDVDFDKIRAERTNLTPSDEGESDTISSMADKALAIIAHNKNGV
jgi:hypothetical protein